MTYEIVQSPDASDEWLVETINHEGDGEVYSVLFHGP